MVPFRIDPGLERRAGGIRGEDDEVLGLLHDPQLLLDLLAPLLEHPLQDGETLLIDHHFLLPCHWIPPSLVRFRPHDELHDCGSHGSFNTTIR